MSSRLSRRAKGYIRRLRGAMARSGGRLYMGARSDASNAQLHVDGVASIGTGCLLEGDITLADGVTVGCDCILMAGRDRGGFIRMAEGSLVYHRCSLYGAAGITIGKRVRVGGGTDMITTNRVFDDPDLPIIEQGHRCAPIVIGDDVWLGAHSVVLAGVTIGDGAVVGAGAVVNRDVEPGTVVAGVPARVIRRRGDRTDE